IGIFSINDIRGVLFDDEVGDLVRMKDVANTSIIFTTPSEDLNEVFKKCTIRNLQRIPVVSEEDHSVLVGMLDRREMIQYYNQRIEEIKAGKGISTEDSPQKPSEAHLADFRAIPVKDAMNRNLVAVHETTSLEELREMVYEMGVTSFPVTDTSGRLKGILSLSDCNWAFKKGDLKVTVGDIATKEVITVTDHDNLLAALARITAGDFAILPVVDKDDPVKLLGTISRKDVTTAFHTVLLKK
ncbi:MAG TPA: CBS domain-containing protein, partial [Deltaproteobacteria bacterium]|nr:CBS domain-containing protein [Deltaproteobacteria bacterium]HIJ20349.1 CBS domain-containing protein [Deltaproteobacteria bacterium]